MILADKKCMCEGPCFLNTYRCQVIKTATLHTINFVSKFSSPIANIAYS